jgi:hypothetical protein
MLVVVATMMMMITMIMMSMKKNSYNCHFFQIPGLLLPYLARCAEALTSGEAKGEKATACLADGAVASLRILIVASFRASASR